MPTVSIIIPTFNAQATIERVLLSICAPGIDGPEVIVVDDGSTDATSTLCREFPVKVMQLARQGGPAHARNIGARMAGGELLVFLDADTCLEASALARITAAFESDPHLDGLIGAYDDEPAAPRMLSQYRNLLHCFVHRTARRQACTFWSGCGAIKASVFFEHNGFDESYRRASLEDLEFGYRLHHAGRKVIMVPEVQVKHLKDWTFLTMLQTDIWDRAIPWTELILRERFMPSDLNLRTGQRLSVLAVLAMASLSALGLLPIAPDRRALLASILALLAAILFINLRFYSFLYARRGLLFTIQSIALHLLFYFYNGLAFLMGTLSWAYKSHPIKKLRRRLTALVAG